ncbi:MAG TPA: hypothetical protein VK695_03780 [Steroidobacteraceae bacterium]|jgi:hypothetical protein|nr:hypothetical protein [Steroidobacteraceae bacterium]
MSEDSGRRLQRLICAVVGACAFVSLVFFTWGIAAPGDRPVMGGDLLVPALLVAAALGLWAGYRAQGRWRIAIYVVALLSLSVWVVVPAPWRG